MRPHPPDKTINCFADELSDQSGRCSDLAYCEIQIRREPPCISCVELAQGCATFENQGFTDALTMQLAKYKVLSDVHES